ncbi:hypothetical protein H5J25_05370 [Sphingomonas aliaeris]|uniref:Uncharacterized protein n=1 Tax=Sphingomonas aliaeris TaxID=2759526 RepID=A0A974NWE3_9SPHN|nr:hypothetical protein [Sphingomonas aliaeris]QQV78150.1 hypothetical protein H5J25_05370 [Sphingomonas aliaeris]
MPLGRACSGIHRTAETIARSRAGGCRAGLNMARWPIVTMLSQIEAKER